MTNKMFLFDCFDLLITSYICEDIIQTLRTVLPLNFNII